MNEFEIELCSKYFNIWILRYINIHLHRNKHNIFSDKRFVVGKLYTAKIQTNSEKNALPKYEWNQPPLVLNPENKLMYFPDNQKEI